MQKGLMVLTGALLLSGTACVGAYLYGLSGHVVGAEVALEQSAHFSDDDVRAAADTVIAFFEERYAGCRLQELRYSSEKQTTGYAEPEYLTLYSDFVAFPVPVSDDMFVLNDYFQYNDYDWVLAKNNSGEWEIRTCGYC